MSKEKELMCWKIYKEYIEYETADWHHGGYGKPDQLGFAISASQNLNIKPCDFRITKVAGQLGFDEYSDRAGYYEIKYKEVMIKAPSAYGTKEINHAISVLSDSSDESEFHSQLNNIFESLNEFNKCLSKKLNS